MSRSKITVKEIDSLANEYIDSMPLKRIDILKKMWAAADGRMVIVMFAQKINIEPSELINWINDYYYQKRMWRYRGRKMIITDPPAPVITNDNEEAAEMAKMVAGWDGGEQKSGRRNASSGTTRNKAATMGGGEYLGEGYSVRSW